MYFAIILSGNYKSHLATGGNGLVKKKKKRPKLFISDYYNYIKERYTKRTRRKYPKTIIFRLWDFE